MVVSAAIAGCTSAAIDRANAAPTPLSKSLLIIFVFLPFRERYFRLVPRHVRRAFPPRGAETCGASGQR